MIPESYIESWRSHVPWQTLAMVEEDLVISRALINLYSAPKIQDSLIFRGGTALNKLFKVEINTTEHFQVRSPLMVPYSIDSEWFQGNCMIATYEIEELLATKLRALYQRRKGRDLFDLWQE